jgi:hypothetical protein
VKTKTVYLIHFDEPYKHARHYVGSAVSLDARLEEHRRGSGSRLMAVIAAARMTKMSLDSIEQNYTTEPPRIVIYGPHGIGKTTFGAAAPNAVILPIEKGLAGIRAKKFPLATSYADVVATRSTRCSPRSTTSARSSSTRSTGSSRSSGSTPR